MTDFQPSVTAAIAKDKLRNRHSKDLAMPHSSPDIESAISAIVSASVGSCTCDTKTPEIEHHDKMCRYALLMRALDHLNQPARCSAGTEDAAGDAKTKLAAKIEAAPLFRGARDLLLSKNEVELIVTALRSPDAAATTPHTYTEICKNPTCPRGGTPVEIVGSAAEAMRDRNLSLDAAQAVVMPENPPDMILAWLSDLRGHYTQSEHANAGRRRYALMRAEIAALASPITSTHCARAKVIGRVTGQEYDGDQVPGIPGAICHACGLKDYPCTNPDCPKASTHSSPHSETRK